MQRQATTPTGRLATAVARPPKLPWCATHVVKACHELTPAEKLTWCEHMMLDNGLDGCYAGAGPLAARLGCSRHTVEIHRRRFVAADLLTRGRAPAGYTDHWFPTLPPQCVPPSTRLSADLVARLADRLDLHLRRLKGTANRPATPADHALDPSTMAPSTPADHDGELGATICQSGTWPRQPNTREHPTKRQMTTPGEGLTDGDAGEAGDDGDDGTAKDSIRGGAARGPQENAPPDADAEPVPAWRTAELAEPEAWPEPPEDESADAEAQRPDEQVADTPEPFEDRYGL